MAYEMARNCFQENLQRLGTPATDPMAWNLNAGLDELTQAVQQDIQRLEETLVQILRRLK